MEHGPDQHEGVVGRIEDVADVLGLLFAHLGFKNLAVRPLRTIAAAFQTVDQADGVDLQQAAVEHLFTLAVGDVGDERHIEVLVALLRAGVARERGDAAGQGQQQCSDDRPDSAFHGSTPQDGRAGEVLRTESVFSIKNASP